MIYIYGHIVVFVGGDVMGEEKVTFLWVRGKRTCHTQKGLYRLSWRKRLIAGPGGGNRSFKRRVCTIGVVPTPCDEFGLRGPLSMGLCAKQHGGLWIHSTTIVTYPGQLGTR